MRKIFFLMGVLLGLKAHGMEGIATLEQQLFEKNQTLATLKNDLQAKESLVSSSYSTYYPTLSAVAGWAEVRVDAPNDRDKGYFGYLDGRWNLFNGFKSATFSNQRDTEVRISKIEYEQKKRELRLQLIEVTSEMIYLHKLQEILIQEEKVTKDQKSWAGKKVSAGLTSSVDNLEFDLREEEIRIQHRKINQLHEEAHQKLVQLLGGDISDEELNKLNFTPIEKLIELSVFSPEKNLETEKAKLQIQLAELENKEVRAEFLPSVDFVYSFGRVTPSEATPLNFNETKYGLQISLPLFTGFDTYYKNRSAGLNTASKRARSHQSRLDSLSLFNSLNEKTKELRDLYQINERKLGFSKKYFEMTVSEYKRGVKNSPDLVGATERWFSSQKTKYEILKELELTKVRIDNLN